MGCYYVLIYYLFKVYMELVSIIIVTYNAEKTLDKAIESIINQTYKNIECLVIDGASTDNTINIIKKYNIGYISEPDRGIYDAMNKGWQNAKGKWILYLGADDELINDSIESLIHISKDADIVYGECLLRFPNGKIKLRKNRALSSLGKYLPCCHQSLIMKKDLFNKLNGFNLDYKILGDLDLIQRAYLYGCKFQELQKPISIFSTGGISTNNLKAELERYKIMKRNKIIKLPLLASIQIFSKKLLLKVKHKIQ